MPPVPTEDDLAFVKTGIGSGLDTVAVYNLLRTHSYLTPFIDGDLRQQNLTAAQFNLLLVLRQAGSEGKLMGEIGQQLIVTKSNITGLVDRLEKQGLVARAEHSDRRATVVRLTEAGSQIIDQTVPQHARALTELTACLTDDEKQSLVVVLTKLRRELRRRRQVTP